MPINQPVRSSSLTSAWSAGVGGSGLPDKNKVGNHPVRNIAVAKNHGTKNRMIDKGEKPRHFDRPVDRKVISAGVKPALKSSEVS